LDFIVGALEYKLGARGLRSCEGGLNRCVWITKFDKKLKIDLEYANEALNKNLLKRLEIALKLQFLKTTARSFNWTGFLMGNLNYLLLFEKRVSFINK
jgi:hypothetical protein